MTVSLDRARFLLSVTIRLARVLFSRLLGTGLQFGAQVAAGRILGPAAVGYLGVSQGYILLFGTLAGLGLPTFILRRLTPRSHRPVDIPHTSSESGWLWFSVIITAIGGGVFAVVFSIYWASLSHTPDQQGSAAALGMVISAGIVSYAYAKLFAEYLKGRGKPAAGLMVEFTAPYAASLLFTLPLWLIDLGRFGVLMPTVGFVSAFIIAMSVFLVRTIKSRSHLSLRNMARRMNRSWNELLGLLTVQIGNQLSFTLPVALVFAFSTATSAGVLVIILRLTGLAATITSIFSAYFSPLVVSAHRTGDFKRKRTLYIASALGNGTSCAAVCLVMIMFPNFFLGLFGANFSSIEASVALQLTAGARVVRHYLGLTEVFLTLTGNTKFDVASQIVSLIALAGGLGLTVATGHAANLIWTASAVAVSSLVRPLLSVSVIASRKGLLRQ